MSCVSGTDSSDLHRRDRLVQHTVELLAAVRALGDAEPLALKVDEGLGGRFQDLGRQHGRPCAEVEYAVAHAALLPLTALGFKRHSPVTASRQTLPQFCQRGRDRRGPAPGAAIWRR